MPDEKDEGTPSDGAPEIEYEAVVNPMMEEAFEWWKSGGRTSVSGLDLVVESLEEKGAQLEENDRKRLAWVVTGILLEARSVRRLG